MTDENPSSSPFMIGDWSVKSEALEISKGGETIKLEPKVMELLLLLAAKPGKVISKGEIYQALWPDVIVGEDTLPRTISRLRKALGDTAKVQSYIKTIAKRGYCLIAPVKAVEELSEKPQKTFFKPLRVAVISLLVIGLGFVVAQNLFLGETDQDPSKAATLTERAEDFYIKITRVDNETAIALYEEALAEDPEFAPAYAGLANALVQRVIRWQGEPGDQFSGATSLGEALQRELNQTPVAMELLKRAEALAKRAVELAPNDPDALKALGFVASAQGNLDKALTHYQKAIQVDANAWPSIYNLGDIYQIKGDEEKALHYFEEAYLIMEQVYEEEPQRIGVWHAQIGNDVAARYEALGKNSEAEIWYRRVLVYSPLDATATIRLANLMAASEDIAQAKSLCFALVSRVGEVEGCKPHLDPADNQ